MSYPNRITKDQLDKVFDLIIIGGGINGAGVARDAAARGLSVLLLDKNDFASGCSAHSTRLIHGGLRYLQYFEFSLVYESLQERETLLKNYPHLVKAIKLVIQHNSYNPLPAWMIKVGMILYDLLSFKKSLDGHKSYSSKELKDKNFSFNKKDLDAVVSYYDGQIPFAERLVLENILTAQEAGAITLNHCEVKQIISSEHKSKKTAQGLVFYDLLTKQEYSAKAKNIINLSGPWVDLVNQKSNHKVKRQMGGTKGSHIMVNDFIGAPKDSALYVEAKSDGRPFFILPFKLGENQEKYLIGTTDIFNAESLDSLEISQKEIDYLLSESNHLFPEAKLSQADIIKSFAGVRPLPYVKDPKSAGAVSRKAYIYDHSAEGLDNYYSVIGGKLTSFRSLSEEIVDLFSSKKSTSSTSKTISCDFGTDYQDYLDKASKDYVKDYKIDITTATHLIKLYGSRAKEVLELSRHNPELKNKIDDHYCDIKAQIVFAIRFEQAYTIRDVLERRLSLGLLSDSHSSETIELIARQIAEEFKLDKDAKQKLISDFY